MDRFERLNGLPGTGPRPEQFTASDWSTHSEGLVVRFNPDGENEWVGNFHGGIGSCEGVWGHPDEKQIVVVSGGQGYVVDPETRQVTLKFGAAIESADWIATLKILLFNNQGISFTAVGEPGRGWRSRRLSWDGFRNLSIRDEQMVGEALNPMTETWVPFGLDLRTGKSWGGSYNESDSDENEKLAS